MTTQDDLIQQYAQDQETYKRTELFGGAITADLPTSFGDVSDIREIPDNQEVYLHKTQLSSIVLDILERVERPQHPIDNDEQALMYHYKDITEEGHVREDTESEEETQIWESGKVVIPHLGGEVPAYSMFATQSPRVQPPAAARSGKPPVVFTGILMTLIRLEKQKTDLIISVNVPHAQGEYNPDDVDPVAQKPGPLLTIARLHQQKLLESFKIEDWGLFVED